MIVYIFVCLPAHLHLSAVLPVYVTISVCVTISVRVILSFLTVSFSVAVCLQQVSIHVCQTHCFFYYQYCLIVVPSPPVNARYLSVTSKAAIIVWSRSLVPNGQLSYYKMHYAAGNKRTCYTSHSNAIRVAGSTEGRLFDLKPSTSYCVWVAAVNIRSADNQHLISNSSNVLTVTTLTAGALPYFH